MAIKDSINRLDMQTKPVVYVSQSAKEQASSHLKSEIFISIYSDQTFEASKIKEVGIIDAITGYSIDPRITPSKAEWIHPVIEGITDLTTLIYHLTLDFELKASESGQVTHLSVPELSTQLTFTDDSSLRSWPTSGDGHEATTLALNF